MASKKKIRLLDLEAALLARKPDLPEEVRYISLGVMLEGMGVDADKATPEAIKATLMEERLESFGNIGALAGSVIGLTAFRDLSKAEKPKHGDCTEGSIQKNLMLAEYYAGLAVRQAEFGLDAVAKLADVEEVPEGIKLEKPTKTTSTGIKTEATDEDLTDDHIIEAISQKDTLTEILSRMASVCGIIKARNPFPTTEATDEE